MASKNFHDLTRRTCKPCEGGVEPLDDQRVDQLLGEAEGWQRDGEGIARPFVFKDHYQVMAFVNAVAWISHAQNHHPEVEVGYNQATVRYTTHAVAGLTENDFICAAKVSALLDA